MKNKMNIQNLESIRNYKGEHFEYEEYFRRVLEEIESVQTDRSTAIDTLFSLLSPSRSSSIIECAIKVLHSVGASILPDRILPVLEIGDSLELFCMHVLSTEMPAGADWAPFTQALLKTETLLPFNALKIFCRLVEFESVRTLLAAHLENSFSVNAVRLSKALLGQKQHFSALLHTLSIKYLRLIGSEDSFLSKEAAFFSLAYRNAHSESTAFSLHGLLHERPEIASYDNYVRDVFMLLPQDVQSDISKSAYQNPPNISFICTLLNLPGHISLSKRTLKHVSLNEPPSEEQGQLSIALSDDYYKRKNLSHLFSDHETHHSCIEH
ncbi:uncharacterized protein NEMAJ01_2165 [Nematocida major]|uniref:uncharacterized protein n=1 Tax=Nematocida major TaxID=1912982 RepID=UPI0020074EC2|nr:uncharacterized protein NEMAJ01_2165 [Nematocida major]KAH9387269.1 hypothetical protein NEMAJ01_2165 [Nematocida major]